ncbi:hypothetical protein SSS_09870 [Sarcoptes scabiei]|uniref:Uncharacterized protein n=1 Tax=Sarcoptes scabiei TaxID=52283 RepID=A0A834VHU5_SARSC|nr:hypothetical protein SSS_09870 [Sarcoptes scabiei]
MKIATRSTTKSLNRNRKRALNDRSVPLPIPMSPIKRINHRWKLSHLQVITNRRRSIYVSILNEKFAILTMETFILFTTIKHHYDGELRKRFADHLDNETDNLGLVSQYSCTDLVKLIHLEDLPTIVAEIQSGKSLNQIVYSSWPLLERFTPIIDCCHQNLSNPSVHCSSNLSSITASVVDDDREKENDKFIPLSSLPVPYSTSPIKSNSSVSILTRDCDRLISILFNVTHRFHMLALRTSSQTCRLIKTISSNLIRF